VQEELRATRSALEDARAELDRLRAITNAADNRLAIERNRPTEASPSRSVRWSRKMPGCGKNWRLSRHAVVRGAQRQCPVIYRFKVEPDVLPGSTATGLLLLTPTTRQGRDFNGRLELLVNLTEGGRVLS